MVIRDDRKRVGGQAAVPPDQYVRDNPAHFSPDRVLYDCPDCGRSHFVTVDACPDAATALRETAMVDGRKRAA